MKKTIFIALSVLGTTLSAQEKPRMAHPSHPDSPPDATQGRHPQRRSGNAGHASRCPHRGPLSAAPTWAPRSISALHKSMARQNAAMAPSETRLCASQAR